MRERAIVGRNVASFPLIDKLEKGSILEVSQYNMREQMLRKIQKNILTLKGAAVAFLVAVVALLNLLGFIPDATATTNTVNGLKVEKLVSNTEAPEWKDEVFADPGDIVEFKLTFWNLTGETMTGVSVRDKLPEGLTYFPGHFHIIANAGQVDNPANLNDLFGSGINISDYPELDLSGGLPPYDGAHGWEYVEVLFKAKIECPTVPDESFKNWGYVRSDQAGEVSATAKVKGVRLCSAGLELELELEKIVSNTEAPAWGESVGAEYADRVEFKLTFKNTGEVTLENVAVRDVLPLELTYYADGKIKIVRNSGTAESTDADAFFGSGLNVGDLSPYDAAHGWEYTELTFIATVNTCSPDGTLTITNTSYLKSDEVSEISDSANVEIARCAREGTVLGAQEMPKVLAATGPEDLLATTLYLGYLGFLLRKLRLTKYF